ncbi:MAG: glycosyltransferase, partial [Candidatus Kaiserbacteria bacterium]|nr:glycosyltransferase [Candidatus Kaiserbacteria bacterium]
ARAKLAPHVPSEATWIGGIGELHPNKNWSAAIEAMTSLPPHTQLLIIHDGEERERLETLILTHELEDRVHLIGYVDNAPKYLLAFDVFLLPSVKEGLPYVLLEAGLAGLPIVASNLPGNQDIIDTGHTGLLVEPTPQLLGTALGMLVRDESMRNRMGTALQETIQKTFSLERMCRETFATYSVNNSRG